MSRDATVSFVWAGDERTFKLGIGECLALEERRDAGLAEIAGRLAGKEWRIEDARQTLRLGLIGAGVEGIKAKRLVEDTVTPGNLFEHVIYAYTVVMAAIQGAPDEDDIAGSEDAEKPAAAGGKSEPEGFPPARSTEPARRSASRRKKSTK